MKKNASCKGIRTNLTSHATSFRPLSKKALNLDLISNKPYSPSTIALN